MNNTKTADAAKSCCGPDCCGGEKSNDLLDVVREKYAQVARGSLSSRDQGVRKVAEAFGYSPEELAAIPAEANMGLSCGNPVAMASLKSGETVVDLGSGGGLDVFLAAHKVGTSGRAIGIDMTDDMLARARQSAADGHYTNVEFHRATIDRIPLNEASVDCIISNCVINLAPDKAAVFREMFRVLKPGGRLAISDIALKKPLPPELAGDLMAIVGCVAGAISIEAYRIGLQAAGFSAVAVADSGADLNAYGSVEGQSGCCSPAMSESAEKSGGCCSATKGSVVVHEGITAVLAKYNINEFAASVKIFAVKPQ